MNTESVFYLSVFLFSIGIMVVLTRRSAIMILIGTELMLNAANLNLVAFNQLWYPRADGQMTALFVIILAVCEAAVGLAIILKIYQSFNTSIPEKITGLKEK